MPKLTFQMSAEASLLMAHLREAPIGRLFTYQELADVISQPVAASFGPLRTALRRLQRDEDAVFGCVRGAGFRRLSDAEIVDEGVAVTSAIRRKAQRGMERQLKADFSSLDRERQMRFSAQTSVMAAVAMMSKASAVARITAAVPEGQRQLPVAETFRMFAKK